MTHPNLFSKHLLFCVFFSFFLFFLIILSCTMNRVSWPAISSWQDAGIIQSLTINKMHFRDHSDSVLMKYKQKYVALITLFHRFSLFVFYTFCVYFFSRFTYNLFTLHHLFFNCLPIL